MSRTCWMPTNTPGVVCGAPATHECADSRDSCAAHKSSCCKWIEPRGGKPYNLLQRVGTFVFNNGDYGIRGCPRELLEECLVYLDRRILAVAHRVNNHKTRCHINWLGQWVWIINTELARSKTPTGYLHPDAKRT